MENKKAPFKKEAWILTTLKVESGHAENCVFRIVDLRFF